MHRCIAKCPDCSTFCQKESGHDGLHGSSAHRNKQDCIFIASSQETMFGSQKTESALKIQAGESATPLFCDQSCSQRGRGHNHPRICLKGDNCAAIKYPGRAVHSKLKFYPYLDKTYDLLSCDIYWKSRDWIPPVFTKNEQAQATFQFCKFYCNHPDHGEEKVFCQDQIFHSDSEQYHDHNFPCHHQIHSKYDVVFVIDSTGSMGWCFNKVKQSIEEILKNIQGKQGISTRFGIVSYTDHKPDDNGYGEPPVKYFGDLENQSNSTYALNFLHPLTAGGGGGAGGEAVVDGLHCANTQIKWRDKSQRVYILALDQGPHGQEFAGSKYQFPGGCPCKLNWKHILNEMKSHKSQFLFVNCGGSSMNLTIDLFESHYREGWNLLNLDDVKQFDLKVANFVGKIVESNYEFSLK